MEISLSGSTEYFNREKKESANFKIDQLVLPSFRKRKKKHKNKQPQKLEEHHQVYQHMHNRNYRRGKKGTERLCEEIPSKHSKFD